MLSRKPKDLSGTIMQAEKYLFHLSGTIRGRVIDVTAEHPRRCASTSPGGYKWASGFYFGGTSTAPQPITGFVHEPP